MTTKKEQTIHQMATKDLHTEAPPFFTNPRTTTGLGKGEIKELADDIEQHGMTDPMHVIEYKMLVPVPQSNGGTTPPHHYDEKKGFLIVDGQRRKFAADLLELKTVPVIFASNDVVVLDEKSGAAWELYALRTVAQRRGLSSFEQAQAAAKSRKSGETNEKIGAALNRSASWVSRFINAFESATPELRTSWAKGEVTDEQFKDLASVKPDKQPAAVAQTVSIRATGDKSTARATAKAAAPAKPLKPAMKVVPPPKSAPAPKSSAAAAATGKSAPPTPAAPPAPKFNPPAPKILHEIVDLRAKYKPVNGYVRGLADGVALAVGAVPLNKLEPTFNAWVKQAATARSVAQTAAAKAAAKKKPVVTKRPPKKKQVTLKKAKARVAAKTARKAKAKRRR